jgi:hypothetical protein
LVISASGWTDHGVGDTLDVHDYAFYPSAPVTDGFGNRRALVFGELGGHNLLLPGKKWYPDQTQKRGPALERAGGRMNFNSTEDLSTKYPFYMQGIRHFHARYGYQGYVYTQITDVEHECNGWLTYDRKISKLPAEEFRRIHHSLSSKLTYAPLALADRWEAGRVDLVGPGPDAIARTWTSPTVDESGFEPAVLPLQQDPIAPVQDGSSKALGLRQTFTVDATPDRAVIEVRAAHRDAWAAPPVPRLDGHRARARARVAFVTYLDGKLHRRGAVQVERGQGEAVTFLELTPSEVQSLTPGSHALAIEVQNPHETVLFDAQLFSYAEE